MIKLGEAYINEKFIEAIFPTGSVDPFSEFKPYPDKTQYVVILTQGRVLVSTSENEVRIALMSVGLLDGHDSISVELSPDEEDKLQRALADGYRYIARDSNQQVFVYIQKPEKGPGAWRVKDDDEAPLRIKGDFDFLDWEDDEPSEIAPLLGFMQKGMD